jgi:hypothetical protein
MQNAIPVSTPLASHFKLTKEMCPKTQEEIEYMSRVPCSSAVGSLMYVMVCTRPDIAHVVGFVSRYMNNPGKEHWEAVKWIPRYLIGIATHALCFCWSRKSLLDCLQEQSPTPISLMSRFV